MNSDALPISTKHSIAICNFIRGKKIEQAIIELEEIARMKKALPMKGEIPHRKGIGSGRYPVKACNVFMKLLKTLAANSNVNELEDVYIHLAKANVASRPYRRFGSRRFKRTHVALVAKETPRKKKPEGKKMEEKKLEGKKPAEQAKKIEEKQEKKK